MQVVFFTVMDAQCRPTEDEGTSLLYLFPPHLHREAIRKSVKSDQGEPGPL